MAIAQKERGSSSRLEFESVVLRTGIREWLDAEKALVLTHRIVPRTGL